MRHHTGDNNNNNKFENQRSDGHAKSHKEALIRLKNCEACEPERECQVQLRLFFTGSSEIMIGEEQKKQKRNLNRLPLIRISVSTL
jgi:hypothetical protein